MDWEDQHVKVGGPAKIQQRRKFWRTREVRKSPLLMAKMAAQVSPDFLGTLNSWEYTPWNQLYGSDLKQMVNDSSCFGVLQFARGSGSLNEPKLQGVPRHTVSVTHLSVVILSHPSAENCSTPLWRGSTGSAGSVA